MGLITNSKKNFFLTIYQYIFFLMKIIAMTIQSPRTSPKLVPHNIWLWKNTLSKKQLFLKIQLHLHFWVKSHKAPFFTFNTIFFNKTIWQPTVPAFQNTFTFYQYRFNSRSSMHVNLDYMISLHLKNSILPTFSGQTLLFLGKKQETRTNTLHHHKAWSNAFFLA